MIDFRIYNLVFWRREDNQRFAGRRVCSGHYVIIDLITNDKTQLTEKTLNRTYTKDANNKKAQSRLFKRIA